MGLTNSLREEETEGPGRTHRRREGSRQAASPGTHPSPNLCQERERESRSGREDAQKHPVPESGLPVEVNSPPLNLSWGFGSAVGSPFQLRRGHLSLRDQLLASEATGRSPWDSGLSRSPEPRRRGPDQGAGSGCVVTVPAWPRGRCPRRPWRTPHPRHGPGPAPGRRAFAARGGVCCFCSQPERERDGCWRRNSGLTSDCCCLGFCFFFWGTLTSFSSRALLC